ncbi:Molybdopterin synthase catalytic subunit [compost metagenome]
MTEKALAEILDEARSRWPLQRATVIHRVGELFPGDEIVFVGVTSAHRSMAFEAAEFIMDYLKTRAPFWKREAVGQGDRWVDARDSDRQAAERWHNTRHT